MMSGYKTNWFVLGAKEGAKKDDCESLSGQHVDSILHMFRKDGISNWIFSIIIVNTGP